MEQVLASLRMQCVSGCPEKGLCAPDDAVHALTHLLGDVFTSTSIFGDLYLQAIGSCHHRAIERI